MPYRMCTHSGLTCKCDDTAMQPCLQALIHRYLEAVRTQRHKPFPLGLEVTVIMVARRNISVLTKSFATLDQLKNWVIAQK